MRFLSKKKKKLKSNRILNMVTSELWKSSAEMQLMTCSADYTDKAIAEDTSNFLFKEKSEIRASTSFSQVLFLLCMTFFCPKPEANGHTVIFYDH